jgi:hypothetical protein
MSTIWSVGTHNVFIRKIVLIYRVFPP